jgi:hypothetical protein
MDVPDHMIHFNGDRFMGPDNFFLKIISMLEIYLQNLEQEINYSAVKDFKNIESLFQDYSAFDKINFKLIHDYLLEDEKDDFFISIPEEDYRPKFFNSIFTSLLLIKLYQNFFHYTRSDSELKRGDLIYAKVKGENRIMEVKGKRTFNTFRQL